MRIVISTGCGFGISLEAAKFMAERGNKQAIAELADFNEKKEWYGYGYSRSFSERYDRQDPDLIAAILQLKDKANGENCHLHIIELPEGIDWEICEYDGNEWIAEKHRKWTEEDVINLNLTDRIELDSENLDTDGLGLGSGKSRDELIQEYSPVGWECPRCRKVNAPYIRECDCPAPYTISTSTGTGEFTIMPDGSIRK